MNGDMRGSQNRAIPLTPICKPRSRPPASRDVRRVFGGSARRSGGLGSRRRVLTARPARRGA